MKPIGDSAHERRQKGGVPEEDEIDFPKSKISKNYYGDNNNSNSRLLGRPLSI